LRAPSGHRNEGKEYGYQDGGIRMEDIEEGKEDKVDDATGGGSK
jgi:hypothetical protein